MPKNYLWGICSIIDFILRGGMVPQRMYEGLVEVKC